MKIRIKSAKFIALAIAIFVLPLLAGCVVKSSRHHRGHGPPAHAPAHGYRNKHVFYYYPSIEVYYNPHRHIYYWHVHGTWKSGKKPPFRIRDSHNRVKLKLKVQRPYKAHGRIKRKYPGRGKRGNPHRRYRKHKKRKNHPGRGRGKSHNRGKHNRGRGKGKYKNDDDSHPGKGKKESRGKGKNRGRGRGKGKGRGR